MMSDYEVQMIKDNMSEFNVKFHGPKDSQFPLQRQNSFHPSTPFFLRFRLSQDMSSSLTAHELVLSITVHVLYIALGCRLRGPA